MSSFNTVMDAVRANNTISAIKLYESGVKICNDWENKNYIVSLAAEKGNIELIQYFRDCDFPWNAGGEISTAYHMAAHNGHVEVLKYLIISECPVNGKHNSIMQYAASGGDLSCLKFLVENNFLTEKNNLFNFAAQHGRLEALKYLYSIGCSWNAEGAFLASQFEHNNWKDCKFTE